ncbi:MAG: hypothetical protein RBR77_04830 [Thauera sp.]|nr:hypothetical protein [Thauera sp.]
MSKNKNLSLDKTDLSKNQNIYTAMHKKCLQSMFEVSIIRLSRMADAGNKQAAVHPNGVSSTLLLWCGFNAVPNRDCVFFGFCQAGFVLWRSTAVWQSSPDQVFPDRAINKQQDLPGFHSFSHRLP